MFDSAPVAFSRIRRQNLKGHLGPQQSSERAAIEFDGNIKQSIG